MKNKNTQNKTAEDKTRQDKTRQGESSQVKRRGGLPIWADIATAFLFLSRIPMPYYGGRLGTAAWAFPLVGWLVGAIGAGVFILATFLGLTGWLAAVLAVSATVFVTGALHEDGFSDVADGYWGGYGVEERLSIMHDSRIGTYGALALILNIGLRAGALASFYTPGLVLLVMVAAHGLGRACISVALATQTPVQPAAGKTSLGGETGPGGKMGLGAKTGMAAAAGKTPLPLAVLALLLGLLPFVAFMPAQAALLMAVVPLFAGAGFVQIMKAKLGGSNGDSLGTLCQVVEIATYLTVIAIGNTTGFTLVPWLVKW